MSDTRQPQTHLVPRNVWQASLLACGSAALLLVMVLDLGIEWRHGSHPAVQLQLPGIARGAGILLITAVCCARLGRHWGRWVVPSAQLALAAGLAGYALLPDPWWSMFSPAQLRPEHVPPETRAYALMIGVLGLLNLAAAGRALLRSGPQRQRLRWDPALCLAICIGGTMGGLWAGLAQACCR